MEFIKNVSKGSRFNQVYIPKELENEFEVGDTVKVTLIKKNVDLVYSKGLKLNQFKEDLIRKIIGDIKRYKNIKEVFIVGSFLTKVVGYNDIDIILIVDNKDEQFEEKVTKELEKNYNQNFHVLQMRYENLIRQLKFCPIMRSMFSTYVGTTNIDIPKDIEINVNHIRYLLMMSEDLLEVEMSGNVYLRNLRKLVTIERFLHKKDFKDMEEEVKETVGDKLHYFLREDETLTKDQLKIVRGIIKIKLNFIYKLIKNGQE